MVMMSWRHGVRLSWVLFVTAVAWNPSLLNTVTFDPFTLPSLPVDRRVLSSTVNPNVSFPSNDVLVNIRPLLISQASSKGGRLDPTCAKKNKTKHVKTEKGWTDGSSAFSLFVCLLLFSRRKKGENTMGKKKKKCVDPFPCGDCCPRNLKQTCLSGADVKTALSWKCFSCFKIFVWHVWIFFSNQTSQAGLHDVSHQTLRSYDQFLVMKTATKLAFLCGWNWVSPKWPIKELQFCHFWNKFNFFFHLSSL